MYLLTIVESNEDKRRDDLKSTKELITQVYNHCQLLSFSPPLQDWTRHNHANRYHTCPCLYDPFPPLFKSKPLFLFVLTLSTLFSIFHKNLNEHYIPSHHGNSRTNKGCQLA